MTAPLLLLDVLKDPAILPYLSGLLVALALVGAIFALIPNEGDGNVRKRIGAEKDRSELKKVFQDEALLREREQRNARVMEDALKKLRLEKQLSDASLKQRLSKAGLRQRSQQMMFLLAQVLAPPVVALMCLGLFEYSFSDGKTSFIVYACVGLGGAMLGYVLPGMRVDGMAQERVRDIEMQLPDALDLLTICVESGMSVEQGLARVSKELTREGAILSEEIELLNGELAYLGDRRLAFENFVTRTDSPTIRTLVSALVQAEKYGTPVGQALRTISGESRFNRMSAAESKAASLPAKLTVPMMVFFLPALFIVILGPAVIQAMSSM